MKKTKLLQRSRFTQLAGTLQRMQIHKHVTTRPHRSKQFQKSEFMGCSRTRKASGVKIQSLLLLLLRPKAVTPRGPRP